MAAIIEAYNSVFSDKAVDSRTHDWPLISGSWKILGIITIYLSTIYIILPIYMRYRKPFDLQWIIRIYNTFQIIACSLLIYGVTTSGWTTHYKLSCQPVDYSNDKMAVRMASYVWWHLMLKIVDMIETTFFVLRKKFNQVSILHVYHHISVVITAWVVCKYIPGGMATFTIPLNSSVHVLMYIYYILASLGPEMQKKLKVIKSKLTAIQIIQLTLIVIHSLQVFLPSCHVNVQMKWICAFYVTNVMMMIFLFLRFYFKSFAKKKKNV